MGIIGGFCHLVEFSIKGFQALLHWAFLCTYQSEDGIIASISINYGPGG